MTWRRCGRCGVSDAGSEASGCTIAITAECTVAENDCQRDQASTGDQPGGHSSGADALHSGDGAGGAKIACRDRPTATEQPGDTEPETFGDHMPKSTAGEHRSAGKPPRQHPAVFPGNIVQHRQRTSSGPEDQQAEPETEPLHSLFYSYRLRDRQPIVTQVFKERTGIRGIRPRTQE